MMRSDNSETRKLAAEIVANGGLIAFRTDTFYGLGVDPFSPHAVARIKTLKGREEGKPILLLISDIGDTERLLQSKSTAFDHFSKKFWPGPLTIVAPAVTELPLAITAGTGTVGLRLPDVENVRLLVRACGGSLTATSANPAGREPAAPAVRARGGDRHHAEHECARPAARRRGDLAAGLREARVAHRTG